MKTKTLIKLLQEADPSGEEEVCIENQDIMAVYPDEAVWDGCLEVLERDSNEHITKAKVISEGIKIVISPLSIESAIIAYPNLDIEYDGYSEKYYRDIHEECRGKRKYIEGEIAKERERSAKACQSMKDT